MWFKIGVFFDSFFLIKKKVNDSIFVDSVKKNEIV